MRQPSGNSTMGTLLLLLEWRCDHGDEHMAERARSWSVTDVQVLVCTTAHSMYTNDDWSEALKRLASALLWIVSLPSSQGALHLVLLTINCKTVRLPVYTSQ